MSGNKGSETNPVMAVGKEEKPKKKKLRFKNLQNFLHPNRYVFSKSNKTEKQEKIGSDETDESVPLAHFGTEKLGVNLQNGYDDSKGSTESISLSSSCSGSAASLDRRHPRDKFEVMFKSGRSPSANSLPKVRNDLEWNFKTHGYQEMYHKFVRVHMDSMNSDSRDSPWDGSFPKKSSTRQQLKKLAHDTQLTKMDIMLVKWIVLMEIQMEYPSSLVAGALQFLFQEIIKFQSQNDSSVIDCSIERFWRSTENLMKDYVEGLTNPLLLKILIELPQVSPLTHYLNEYVEMIRNFLHRPRTYVSTFEVQLLQAMEDHKRELSAKLFVAARQWFERLVSTMNSDSTVLTVTKIGKILKNELICLKPDLISLFACFGINLFEIVYCVWTSKFEDLVTPLIQEACSNPCEFIRHEISKTTAIDFEGSERLYQLLNTCKDLFQVTETPKQFHNFFLPCLPKWLDVNCVRALSHLAKAVEKDNLVEDGMHGTSSSAIDAGSIFHTINKLWVELDWPDCKDRYTLAVLIIKNLDRWIMYYAELIYHRTKEVEKSSFEDFELSDQLCVAFNNVETVWRQAESIVNSLNIPQILTCLAEGSANGTALEQCRGTPTALMENMTDKVKRRMVDSFIAACQDIEPMISTLLDPPLSTESADLERLRRYSIEHFNRMLGKLNTKLSPQGFQKTFPILWENAFSSFSSAVETSIETKKSPSTFQHLESLYESLEALFFPGPEALNSLGTDEIEQRNELKSTLHFYATPSPQLILEYYQNRYEAQIQIDLAQSRQSRMTFIPSYNPGSGQLHLEILNASFVPGSCDSYLKVQIVSPHFSETTKKYHTEKVLKKNDHLVIEETITVDLNENEWSSGGIIHFWFKGKNGFLWNKFLGEAFLPLKKVPVSYEEIQNPISYSPQVKLPLTKPSEPNTRILQVLEERTGDILATSFAKIECERMNTLNTPPLTDSNGVAA